MAPLSPPLPDACTLRFQPESGNHTSIRISESGVGVNRAATRQKAGSVLNTFAAAAFGGGCGTNPPAAIDSAEVTVPLASVIFASDSQAIGAATAARGKVSDPPNARTTATASDGPILMSCSAKMCLFAALKGCATNEA